MNQLTKMFEGKQLRIVEQNNEPWFVAKDVCDILGIRNISQTINGQERTNENGEKYISGGLDDDEKATYTIPTQFGKKEMNTVNEFGLYQLVLKSRKPEAKQFKRWVTHEVIPSIRKTGSYGLDTSQLSPELQMMNQMFQAMAKNEIETKEAKKLALEATQTVNNISNIVSLNNVEWREKVTVILRKIAKNWTGVEPYRSVINLSYERLEQRAGCNLNIRLNNRKERAVAKGMTKSYVNKISKLDCIAEEKRLVEIYLQVVKEMAIQFRVNINDFKLEEVI